MKRLVFGMTVFVSAILVFSSHALAGGIGSSLSMPEGDPVGVSVGVDTTFVFERDLAAGASGVTSGEIQESNQISAKANVQVMDYINAYANVGVANLEEDITWSEGDTQTLEFDYGLLLGGGVNLFYADIYDKFGVGWDTQYMWWNTDVSAATGTRNPTIASSGSVDNIDFQTTLYVTYDAKLDDNHMFIPYLGVCYSAFDSEIDSAITIEDKTAGHSRHTLVDMEGDDEIGVVTGLNWEWGQRWLLNVEGRFVSETAVSAAGAFKF